MNSPVVRIVVAYSANRVIGKDNQLPWRLPSDLAHFKRTTMGEPIIMGRKTWDSLGRPLPGRRNLVVTRNVAFRAAGACAYPDLHAALAACQDEPRVCIIGGEQIFKLALPITDEIIATEVNTSIEGDTWFPALDERQWREVERLPQAPENGLQFDFVTYQRVRA